MELTVANKTGGFQRVKLALDYGAVISVSVMPEMRPIGSFCVAPDGYIFSKWRDLEYRGNSAIDEAEAVMLMEMFEGQMLLPGTNKIYALIHPSGKTITDWAVQNRLFDGQQALEGVNFNRLVISLDLIKERAERAKK